MKLEMMAVIGLILGIFLQIGSYLSTDTRFEVMPVFTPVSLQYEQKLLGGEKPKRMPDVMRFLKDTPAKNIDRVQLEALKKEREELLRLRNERHELNIKMMENSISILSALHPEQWDFIQSNRDEIQARIELDIMEQLLQEADR